MQIPYKHFFLESVFNRTHVSLFAPQEFDRTHDTESLYGRFETTLPARYDSPPTRIFGSGEPSRILGDSGSVRSSILGRSERHEISPATHQPYPSSRVSPSPARLPVVAPSR